MIQVSSTSPDEIVYQALRPVALGTVEEISGEQYEVVSNDQTVLVTYKKL